MQTIGLEIPDAFAYRQMFIVKNLFGLQIQSSTSRAQMEIADSDSSVPRRKKSSSDL